MKYAFCIPIYNTISGRLLPQFLNLQEWCPQLDGQIYTVVGRTHADARNWLCTDGGGFSNPNGIGTVYRRSQMEKYGLNMDIIDENQFNTWYRAHNVQGKQLRFTLDPEFKKRNPKMASSTVEAVVDGIFKNNGNICILYE